MGLWARMRTTMRRIGAAPWETKIGVAIPLLLAMLAVPAMLGAFASEVGTADAGGGYGTTTTLAPPPPPTTVAGGGTGGTTPGSSIVEGSQTFPGGTMTVKLTGFMAG